MKTDLLVIGGSAGGILSATTARKANPEIKVTLVRKTETVMVPCGIPYIFGTLLDTAKNRMPDAVLLNAGVDLIIDEVVSIDTKQKSVDLAQGETISYEKLVIATGSLPVVPGFIAGHDLKNVFPIVKDENVLSGVMAALAPLNTVAVIGGGFIGVEFAEQLRIAGKNVILVEQSDHCLWQSFDDEFCEAAEQAMRDQGIVVRTNSSVKQITGPDIVTGVELASGENFPADAVIFGIGVIPNTSLAAKAGIEVNTKGAIVVDEYMRTSVADVFAVGDAVQKKCYFTGNDLPVLLASTAAMEARVAAVNLYGLDFVRENTGTISAFSTRLFDITLAAAGLTERRARDEGFSVKIGTFTSMDKHPGSLPDTSKVVVKLLFAAKSGVLMGAQIQGGVSAGEMINILSLAIQKGMTANELHTFQVATHPLLTASPVTYPINGAAFEALIG